MTVPEPEEPPWPTARVLITPDDRTKADLFARYPDGVRPGDVIYTRGDVICVAGTDRVVARDTVVSPEGMLYVEFLPPDPVVSHDYPYGCIDLNVSTATERYNKYTEWFARGDWNVTKTIE